MTDDFDFKHKNGFSQARVRRLRRKMRAIEARKKTTRSQAEAPPQPMWHNADGLDQMIEFFPASVDSEASARVVPSHLVAEKRAAFILDALLNGLRRTSEQQNGKCQQALFCIGPQIRRRLLLEARAPQGGAQYKIRLLKVIARMGTIHDADEILMLIQLEQHNNQDVREMATDVKHHLVPGIAGSASTTVPIESAATRKPDLSPENAC